MYGTKSEDDNDHAIKLVLQDEWKEYLLTYATPCTEKQMAKILQICTEVNVDNPWQVVVNKYIPEKVIVTRPFLSEFNSEFFRRVADLQPIRPYQSELLRKMYFQHHQNQQPPNPSSLPLTTTVNINNNDDDDMTRLLVGADMRQFKKITLKNAHFKVQHTHVLEAARDYEYGYQQKPTGRMFYVKLYDMFVLDYDDLTQDEVVEDLTALCKEYNLSFAVYQTQNGYHAFLVSHLLPYYSRQASMLFKQTRADFCYFKFCKKNAYNVRVSTKPATYCSASFCINKVRVFVCTVGIAELDVGALHRLEILEKYTNLHRSQTHLCNVGENNNNVDEIESISHVNINPLVTTTTIPILPNTFADFQLDDTSSFYAYFLNRVINEKATVPNKYIVKRHAFRRFLCAKYIKHIVQVMLGFVPYFHSVVQRPQQLLQDHSEYFVAMDLSTKCIYMNYKHVMMLDLDNIPSNEIDVKVQELHNWCLNQNTCCAIYKTTRGLHVFFIDKKRNHKCHEGLQTAYDLGCDFNYILFTYVRAWSVRLSPKAHEDDEQALYSEYGLIGDEQHIDNELYDLVKLHFTWSQSRTVLREFLSTSPPC